MKKKFWISIKEFDKKVITSAMESGVDAIYAPNGFVDRIKELGDFVVLANDGDLKQGEDFEEITIRKKEDEIKVENIAGRIPVIIRNIDWEIIPLENLISKTSNLIQMVKDSKQAKLAIETLEKGADGILLDNPSVAEIKKTAKIIQTSSNEKLQLVEASIIEKKSLGISDRVCIDTASILLPGHGALVGDTSSASFLVHNENVQSPFCDPRPFRINAGAVHAYVKLVNDKMKYLMELRSGDEIVIVEPNGKMSSAIVGRAKIEKRPMMLIVAEYKNKKITLIMQNAETIRLTSPEGKPLSVVKLKKGDKVLAYLEEGGRHFGVKVEETIKEQ